MKILFMLPAAEGVYPPEAAERRIKRIKSHATASTQIDVDYMPGVSGFNPYGGGQVVAEPDAAEKMARAHELGAQRARQAEEEGYDAFCPLGVLDIGVAEARRQGVKIPMAGPGEASALFSGLIGRPFASCRYVRNDEGEATMEAYHAGLGLKHLYVGSTAIGLPNSEYPHRHDEVLQRYVQCAEKAKKMGAELMGVIAYSICPGEFSSKELFEATGLPAVDHMAVQVGMVELWHRTGLPPSLLKLPRN
jgi:hypothetical protein